MGFLEKLGLGGGQEEKPEMGVPGASLETPEIQETPAENAPSISTVNGALEDISQQEEEERKREQEIEDIERKPTIH